MIDDQITALDVYDIATRQLVCVQWYLWAKSEVIAMLADELYPYVDDEMSLTHMADGRVQCTFSVPLERSPILERAFGILLANINLN